MKVTHAFISQSLKHRHLCNRLIICTDGRYQISLRKYYGEGGAWYVDKNRLSVMILNPDYVRPICFKKVE